MVDELLVDQLLTFMCPKRKDAEEKQPTKRLASGTNKVEKINFSRPLFW